MTRWLSVSLCLCLSPSFVTPCFTPGPGLGTLSPINVEDVLPISTFSPSVTYLSLFFFSKFYFLVSLHFLKILLPCLFTFSQNITSLSLYINSKYYILISSLFLLILFYISIRHKSTVLVSTVATFI